MISIHVQDVSKVMITLWIHIIWLLIKLNPKRIWKRRLIIFLFLKINYSLNNFSKRSVLIRDRFLRILYIGTIILPADNHSAKYLCSNYSSGNMSFDFREKSADVLRIIHCINSFFSSFNVKEAGGVVKKLNRLPHGIQFFHFNWQKSITVRIRSLDLVPVVRGSIYFHSDFHWFCPVFWPFLHKISSGPLLNPYRMVEFGGIFHLIWWCQGKRVGNRGTYIAIIKQKISIEIFQENKIEIASSAIIWIGELSTVNCWPFIMKAHT
jgi:hypothetical protein